MKANITLLISCVVCMFFISCSKHKDSKPTETSQILSSVNDVAEVQVDESPDIEIGIKLSNTKTSLMPDDPDLYFKCEKSNNGHRIYPTGEYCELTDNTKRTEAPEYGACAATCFNEFPVISCYIVNNNNQSLDITSLRLEVNESSLDTRPLLYIAVEGCYSHTLTLINDGWGSWKKGRLKYTILKKGEKFRGNYSKERKFEYFNDAMIFDFLDDLIGLGYDFEAACMEGEWNGEFLEYYPEYGSPDIFAPFDAGYAKMYGKIILDNGYSKDFKAKISLCCDGLGDGCFDDDSFDVRFKIEGSGYEIEYPYTTVIPPGGSEKISLRLRADKSSNHNFTIHAVNENGLKISTLPISLNFLNPKHSSKIIYSD